MPLSFSCASLCLPFAARAIPPLFFSQYYARCNHNRGTSHRAVRFNLFHRNCKKECRHRSLPPSRPSQSRSIVSLGRFKHPKVCRSRHSLPNSSVDALSLPLHLGHPADFINKRFKLKSRQAKLLKKASPDIYGFSSWRSASLSTTKPASPSPTLFLL